MDLTERRMELYRILQGEKVVALSHLAERFGVSTMTVRRDLHHFEQQGLVTVRGGNAHLNRDTSLLEPSYLEKEGMQTDRKQAIAKAAAELVSDGDAIVVDCGTTTLQLLRHLGRKRVTVITNSVPVVSVAGPNPRIELVLAPGMYDDVTGGLFGDFTVEFLRRFSADKAFIGARGWSPAAGVTDPGLADASAKMTMMAAARKRFLVADSTKYGHSYLMRFARLEEFDAIVCDDGLGDDARSAVRFRCPNLMLAPVEQGRDHSHP